MTKLRRTASSNLKLGVADVDIRRLWRAVPDEDENYGIVTTFFLMIMRIICSMRQSAGFGGSSVSDDGDIGRMAGVLSLSGYAGGVKVALAAAACSRTTHPST